MQRSRILALTAVGVVCSVGGLAAPATAEVDDTIATSTPSTDEVDATSTAPLDTVPLSTDAGRVVVLAEEDVLADVLALGIAVQASSATVPDAGFQGMGDLPTAGIELFDYLTISLEEVAAFDADHLIVWQFAADTVGVDQLAGATEHLHVIPTGTSGVDQLRLLGEAFDRTERAEELIARLDESLLAASEVVPDDCATSVAAIYAGPSVAAFVEPIWDVPRTIDALGCELVPGPGSMEADGNGRVYLSMEQLGVLEGPQLVLMQTDSVVGESDAVAEIEGGPLWATLPAVAADRVSVVDRLGYAGILGEIRLVDDLAAILDA